MNPIRQLHNQAMDLAERAFVAKHEGHPERFLHLSREAFVLEAQAAGLVAGNLEAEPTRSVLHRSAATLAFDCGEFREAERLVSVALGGNPPVDIAEELRDLLEQVYFARHLAVRQVQLQDGQIQLSLTGSEVGLGITLMDILLERLQDIERIIYRTVERLMRKEFRERGSAQQAIQEGYKLYALVPRLGSFAMTLQLGRQMTLPGLDLSVTVVEDVVDNFTLLNTGQEDALQARINDPAYYRNFLALAKRIAPDGEKVRMVGLTTTNNGIDHGVAINRPRHTITGVPGQSLVLDNPSKVKIIIGRLRHADETSSTNVIKLVDENNKKHPIIVPEGMMNDIVRPLWGELVQVTGIQQGKRLQLNDIVPFDGND